MALEFQKELDNGISLEKAYFRISETHNEGPASAYGSCLRYIGQVYKDQSSREFEKEPIIKNFYQGIIPETDYDKLGNLFEQAYHSLKAQCVKNPDSEIQTPEYLLFGTVLDV